MCVLEHESHGLHEFGTTLTPVRLRGENECTVILTIFIREIRGQK